MNQRQREEINKIGSFTFGAFIAAVLLTAATVFMTPMTPSAHAAPAPIPVAEVHDTAATANTNILSTGLTPGVMATTSIAYRVTVALHSTASVVNVQINPTGAGTTREWDLNGGTQLTAGTLYTFTFGATRNAVFNLQCETSTTVGYLLVEEIRDGAL